MGRVARSSPLRCGSTLTLIVALSSFGVVASAAAASPGLAGRVQRASDPVADATVYAYQVIEKSFRKVSTDGAGRFLFEAVPAGLYKIVAHKSGLLPVVLVLARRSADESQFVELDLEAKMPEGDDSFWSVRGEVPGDVLRDLERGAFGLASALTPEPGALDFVGEVGATAGRAELDDDLVAELSGAEIGLRGLLGRLRVEMQGAFQSLDSALDLGSPSASVNARSSKLRVDLSSERAGDFGISAASRTWSGESVPAHRPIGLDSYQLSYARELGEYGSTALDAQYIDETALVSASRFAPALLPLNSRILTLHGSFATSFDRAGEMRAGVRYREGLYSRDRSRVLAEPLTTLDLWSRGSIDLNPTYLVEYGLVTTLHDGNLSFVPRGGLVVRLRPDWQASFAASRRFVDGGLDSFGADFAATLLEDALDCGDSDATCFEAQLAHHDGEVNHLRLRSSWREFDRTVRLFLQEDFFASGEGVFFVSGDRFPEIHASLGRRLGDSVVAHWTTTYAAGGGGQFRAANRRRYENEVAYVKTSLDTQFEPTATALFLTFQRFEQRLVPQQRPGRRRTRLAPEVEHERLELVVSQDLSQLFNLASSWAVQVGMEVARGETLLTSTENGSETRRRLTTGVAVRF